MFNSTRYRDELIEEIDEDDPQYIAYTKARQTAINGSREYGLRAYNQLLARFTKDSGKYLFEAQRFIDGKPGLNKPHSATCRPKRDCIPKLGNRPAKRQTPAQSSVWPMVLLRQAHRRRDCRTNPGQWKRLSEQKTVNPIIAARWPRRGS